DQPSADAACRHDPQAGVGHLYMDAAGTAGAAQGRGDRARGNGSRGRAGAADAVDPATRTVGGNGPLGTLRRPVAENQGSQGAVVLLWPDPRGSGDRLGAPRAEELPAAAGERVPDPDQVPR